MNQVNIIGRITSDLSVETVGLGATLCKFSIAYNEKYGNVEKSYFFDCTSWSKTAEFIANRCKKGGRIGIEGKLVQSRWETPEGQKRSKVEINVMSVTPIDWADSQDQPQTPVVNTVDDNPFSDDQIPF